VVVFSLVLVIASLVRVAFSLLPCAAPYALRLLASIAIEVVLTTWGPMPWITRRLAAWIYPQRKAI
jgi:uncharacterized protein